MTAITRTGTLYNWAKLHHNHYVVEVLVVVVYIYEYKSLRLLFILKGFKIFISIIVAYRYSTKPRPFTLGPMSGESCAENGGIRLEGHHHHVVDPVVHLRYGQTPGTGQYGQEVGVRGQRTTSRPYRHQVGVHLSGERRNLLKKWRECYNVHTFIYIYIYRYLRK